MLQVGIEMTFPAQATINLKAYQASFELHFKLLDVDVLDELRKRCKPNAEGKFEMTDRQFVGELVAGFGDDVLGADGKPLPFTPDNLTALLNKPGALPAVINAFYSGYAEEEEKNLELLPAG